MTCKYLWKSNYYLEHGSNLDITIAFYDAKYSGKNVILIFPKWNQKEEPFKVNTLGTLSGLRQFLAAAKMLFVSC